MAKIAATLDRTLTLSAPIGDVYRFFVEPQQLRLAMADVERFEPISAGTVRWILHEKAEKGIRFQADYTVEYRGNGCDEVTWQTVAGNLDTQGQVHLRSIGDAGTEIRYVETMAPDLPISSLLAVVFKPIVAREVSQGIEQFLGRLKTHFGCAAA